jgi:hypothetical protein
MEADGSGNPQQMFWDLAFDFALSPDGRYLYFPQMDNVFHIRRRDLETGAISTVFESDGTPFAMAGIFIRNQTLFVAVAPGNGTPRAELVAVNLDTKTSSSVIETDVAEDRAATPSIAVSPDGRRIIYPQSSHLLSNIYSLPLGTVK